ncbi:MAG: RNA polymerase subunit sigma-70, partial [Kofleriaceae bacterium]|nr:RNA polymerase subunit sigma-70 [Kofleriaceae bacterium]
GSLMIEKEEHKLLLKSLRKIPMDLQIVLGLYYWEDLSTAELADTLEIPRGTVKSRLRRAREELEAAMREVAGSQQLLRSTIDNLERWVSSLPGLSKCADKK